MSAPAAVRDLRLVTKPQARALARPARPRCRLVEVPGPGSMRRLVTNRRSGSPVSAVGDQTAGRPARLGRRAPGTGAWVTRRTAGTATSGPTPGTCQPKPALVGRCNG